MVSKTNDYSDYLGVLVFDLYSGKATLPKAKQIYYKYDLSKISKFELDKLPSVMINGVKIYGTDKFIKPSEQGDVYTSWGYFDLDLEELGYLSRDIANEDVCIEIRSYSLNYGHMGNSNLWTLTLSKDNSEEYRLKISSKYLIGLTNNTSQYSPTGGLWADRLAKNVRNTLRAFLYKISSEPEILYDAILESWSGPNEKYKIDKEFVPVGDAMIRFDFEKYEYVIKSAK
ncbi:MAG: hypothetical protein GX306_10290 [Clostridiales bacterium]|nr:hypothetical protein [Clostridiales bacterium]